MDAPTSVGQIRRGEPRLPGVDVATLRRAAGRDGVETLAAFYLRQRFRPHAHEGYVLGLIERGTHSVWCRGTRHDAVGGTVAAFNPGEVHHGGAADEAGWAQRMVYLSEAAMRGLAEDIADRPHAALPGFGAPFRHDPAASPDFAAAHRAIHAPASALARDAALVALAAWALKGSSHPPPEASREAAPAHLGRMRDYLHAHVAEDVSLARLAAIGGLRERHTIALFRRHLGLPPHGYHLQLKVASAQGLLRAGMAPAECAAATGFADQSHMARHFRAVTGLTPGAYAAGLRGSVLERLSLGG